MTMTYFEMVEKLNRLKGDKIRLTTQLEELQRREQEELQKLGKLGVTDVNKALTDLTQEQKVLMEQIESSLRGLENATV
jgi:seryl-tRNA synthetase